MRCGCALLIASLFLIYAGATGIREANAFRQPKVMTYEQFVKSPPEEGWFKVTKCGVGLVEAIYSYHKSKYSLPNSDEESKIEDVYLPVYPAFKEGKKPKDAIALVVKTRDPQIIATLKEMSQLEKNSSDEQFKKWAVQHIKEIFIEKDVVGMVESGMASDSKTRSELAGLSSLTPNYAIIEEGRTPSMGSAFGKLIGGIVLLLVSVVYWISLASNRSKAAA